VEPDRLSHELAEKLEAARMTAEGLSLHAELARDTVGRWIRGPTVPSLAALQRVENELETRLGFAVDLSAAARERRSVRQRDRLSVDGTQRGEIVLYLETLIRWLNTDSWAQDAKFGGPALTPAAIERKLRIEGRRGEQDEDADELARRCARLVVLGGPGSGKTWQAKRTARLCAEAALDALSAGALPDEVELPLYTTCTRLSAALPSEGIRRAIVSAALGQLPDLGGSRILDALRALFEERNAPTLLVADSLDETRGADDRIRQADTLPAAWRIVITSRPGSWNSQLAIGDNDPSRRFGILKPLRYPEDVEPFINAWFSDQPARAADLAAQVRNRPALQQTATVPLLLSFYCIIGGDQSLPVRRAELYRRVINRMLTGQWRGSGYRDPEWDPETCQETLRDWAWSAAASHPVSGIGEWSDKFRAPWVKSRDDREALDHVASSLGPPDLDSGMTWRRFAHRSIQEHLVAEHVALRMPAAEAAGELLKHLWFDPDWEYAAPAALAMHSQRSEVLKELLRRVTGGSQLYRDLVTLDGCWEIRRFLARVAQESGEDDWSDEAAEYITRARMDPGTSALENHLVAASGWPTANRLILGSMLGSLRHPYQLTWWLADAIIRLAVTDEDQARAKATITGLLAPACDPHSACRLAGMFAQLNPTQEELTHAKEILLGLFRGETDPVTVRILSDTVAQLNPTQEELAQARESLMGLLVRGVHYKHIADLAGGLSGLNPTAHDRTRTREVLLSLLGDKTDCFRARTLATAVEKFAVTARDREWARGVLIDLLAREIDLGTVVILAETVTRLKPSVRDRARTREALLCLLARKTDPETATTLADTAARLAVTVEDRARGRETLMAMLARATDPWRARQLVNAVTRLAVTEADRKHARKALLHLLLNQSTATIAGKLGEAIARLEPTREEKAQARETLCGLLARESDRGMADYLAKAVAWLNPTAKERDRAREALLGLIAPNSSWRVLELVETVIRLDPTAEDRARAREALLGLLARRAILLTVSRLADEFARLRPTAEELAQAREILLGQLVHEEHSCIAVDLAGGLARLSPSAKDRARARKALLALLPRRIWGRRELMDAVTRLSVTAADQAQAMEALLALHLKQPAAMTATDLVEELARLDPTPEYLARAKDALLSLVARRPDDPWAGTAVALLSPTIADFTGADTWPSRLDPSLLAALRKNSRLPAWLVALPQLSTPSR
jgi:hypothetical protein